MAQVGACRRCRKEQMLRACCRGGLERCSCRLGRLADSEGEDLISALPDDLLLHVLARLRCARAAARTGLLSRRWRRLPELTFHDIAPDPLDAALALVARPALSLLDISVCDHRCSSSVRIFSLLSAAARLAPEKLHVIVEYTPGSAIELPRFHRTISIYVHQSYGCFALPPAGGFPALESLTLVSCQIELADMLPRCPRLLKLKLGDWKPPSIEVHSPSLKELDVETN